MTLFFASHLLIFYVLGLAGVRIGIAFYLWIGVFSMVVVAQFWAFANDLYTNDRGKRLFPILGMGANLGAVAGSGVRVSGVRRLRSVLADGARGGRPAGAGCADDLGQQPGADRQRWSLQPAKRRRRSAARADSSWC